MPITPDQKDWTWVLSRPCPDCAFDVATATPATVPGIIKSLLPRWRAALRRPDAAQRSTPDAWSVLEYAAHVRDVFALFDQRLHLMLDVENAEFDDWDQDAAALDSGYASADPAVVSAELTAEGEQIAASFAAAPESEWSRTGKRSNGSAFTVLTFSQYLLHDVVHHTHDIDA